MVLLTLNLRPSLRSASRHSMHYVLPDTNWLFQIYKLAGHRKTLSLHSYWKEQINLLVVYTSSWRIVLLFMITKKSIMCYDLCWWNCTTSVCLFTIINNKIYTYNSWKHTSIQSKSCPHSYHLVNTSKEQLISLRGPQLRLPWQWSSWITEAPFPI